MITQVDELTVMITALERLFTDPAGQPDDPVGQPCLSNRAGDQPGLDAVVSSPCDQRLDGGERDHEVAEAKGDGRHIRATHAGIPSGTRRQCCSYSVTSSICSAENARRISAHLLHRPQCRPPCGSMHENVCRNARPRPSASTSAFVSPANGVTTSRECPIPRRTSA